MRRLRVDRRPQGLRFPATVVDQGGTMTDFIVETRADDPGVLLVAGELDIATVDELATQAQAALDSVTSVLVIDFGGVTFVDSTGLGALVRIRNEAERHGKRVDLVGVRREVRRVLELTGLSELFPDQADR
jgi:anti-anti-sigma factor